MVDEASSTVEGNGNLTSSSFFGGIEWLDWQYVLYVCASIALFVIVSTYSSRIKPIFLFFYSCFLKPIGSNDSHQAKLESFYQSQAGIYDTTRTKLLLGRETMLRLCAAQLRLLMMGKQTSLTKKPLVWVDLGGGTGWNIEKMNDHFPISNFDKVYVVDLCPSLCKVAQERFSRLGWDNIEVICDDAAKFRVPAEFGSFASLITFSYSLSMIDNIYPVIDHVAKSLLRPNEGVIGVVDFYVSGKTSAKGVDRRTMTYISRDGYQRQLSWFARWFWSVWFDFDSVYLHHSRRDYLEHVFQTLHCFSSRNESFLPFVRIPYYVWLGTHYPQSTVASTQTASPCNTIPLSKVTPTAPKRETVDADHGQKKHDNINVSNKVQAPTPNTGDEEVTSPVIKRLVAPQGLDSHAAVRPLTSVTDLSLEMGKQQIITTRAASYDQTRQQQQQQQTNSRPNTNSTKWKKLSNTKWRQSFTLNSLSSFSNYIYAFTWEDPREDLRVMDIQPDDNILVITSAGCNVLEYALQRPRRIHAVDVNPCQNHLLELKCAAITALDYEDFWKMFGEGVHPEFQTLLDSRISPFLSEHAYNFWKNNSAFLKTPFYYTGWSGISLRILHGLVKICGIEKEVNEMLQSTDLKTQKEIWDKKVRPYVLNPSFFKLLNNPIFLWYSWGVPMAQMQLVYNDKVTPYEYIFNTLDPLASSYLFTEDQYFYYLALIGKYNPNCCPSYLTPSGFQSLKAESKLDCIRIHTDPIIDVFAKIASGKINEDSDEDCHHHHHHYHHNNNDELLTKVVLMDHMDWFSEEEARQEISSLTRVLKKGGKTFWRSAAYQPWYNKLFETYGFKVEPIGVRKPGTTIDRVNMYASFYVATKMV